jgi:hypothetical protein
MFESLALFASVAAVIAVAAIAGVAYQRDKERRFRTLKELEGETVVLGISTDVETPTGEVHKF